jgi:hypothetical protein
MPHHKTPTKEEETKKGKEGKSPKGKEEEVKGPFPLLSPSLLSFFFPTSSVLSPSPLPEFEALPSLSPFPFLLALANARDGWREGCFLFFFL